MTVLIDTSVIVDHLRDDQRAIRLLEELFCSQMGAYAATPTRMEIIAGLGTHEQEPMTRLFALLSWIDIDTTIADAAGALARRYRASHRGVDTTDYHIAASAQSIGARLITLNVKHFPMFPDLEPAYR